MTNQTFEQSVLTLLQHIQTVLPDDQWRSIEVPIWNAVALKFKNNDYGYVGKVPLTNEWEWSDDAAKIIETHLDVRPATHLERDFMRPKED